MAAPALRGIIGLIPRPAARWTRLFGLAAIVGVLAGFAATLLEEALDYGVEHVIGHFTNPVSAMVFQFNWYALLLPALGGLISGILVTWLAPHAHGHGTDLLIRAFHKGGGVLPLKGPVVKGAASVAVIACGGSAGPEGPIAALGAALGSFCGPIFRLRPRERRILLIAGCGAGVGAIFQCPLGGALFAAGILYREPDYETDAIVPAFIASIIGYSTYILFIPQGLHTLPGVEDLKFQHPLELIPYALLGVVCGSIAIFFSLCMRLVEKRLTPKSPLPRWLTPALGGLATGGVACILPQILDGQYIFIKHAMTGELFNGHEAWTPWHWVLLFGAVALAKSFATALTIGSGASGGVLGPGVFVGGAAGAMVGALVLAVAPNMYDPETMAMLQSALVPVGMAGVLSATMRLPLASMVIVAEMTGGYGLIVPLMLVCVSSYVIGRHWGLSEDQVPTAAESPAHAGDAIVHLLESFRVSELMTHGDRQTVPPEATLSEMVERIEPGTRPVFAVVQGPKIVGLVSVPDIERIMSEPGVCDAIIAEDIMTEELATVHPEQDAYAALMVMAKVNHLVLPVVSSDSRREFVGMLTRSDIYAALRRHIDAMRENLLAEHEGLAAIGREDQLQQLVMGVGPARTDNVQRLFVPIQAVGRSLREADFRRKFGVQVIAIEQPDGRLQCPPDPDAPLKTDQRLVAIVFGDASAAAAPDGDAE